MPFNMEGMVRGIGQLQASAMENLWNTPTSGMLAPGAGIGGGSAMLEPGAGIGGGGNAMLEPGFGPFGQAFAGAMLQPDFGMSRDSSGMTALQDMQSLKQHVSAEADRYDAGRAKAAQQSMVRANELQVLNQHYNMDKAPADNTQSAASTTTSPVSSSNPTAGGREVEDYIRQAATSRGIDANIAMKVAMSEGGTETAKRGTFNTGSSWWPFQLHYGGKGYEHLGTTAGMGNAFTQKTGFQPGDPAAWRASVDYALDRARQAGWGDWYGARDQGITGYQGINRNFVPGQTAQNPAPAGSGQPYQVNRTSQFGLGLSREESLAFCGPAAALALTKFYGNNIPVEKVRQAAIEVGWTKNVGMAGPQSQVNLLNKLGLPSQMAAWNDAQAQQLLASGKPLIIDTPGHYFTADQYDPARGYRVGTSGTDLRQGGEWMTPDQMAKLAVAGSPRQMIWKT